MKKSILSSLFLSLVLLFCGIFYGCGGRYDNLSMRASFTYTAESATTLDNDAVRVQTSSGVFDDNRDGTYTFYIKENSTASANLQVNFDGVPDDFNYNASIDFSNNIGKINGPKRSTSNGFIQNVTFYSQGKTTLEILSSEGNKKISINIDVIQIAKNISFKKQNYALTKTNGSFIDLDRTKALSIDGSVVNITYKFGYMDDSGVKPVFVEYSNAELWGDGLEYDGFSNKLVVTDKDRLSLENFVIEATYENPLKVESQVEPIDVDPVEENKDLVAYTSVSVVNEIEEDSFEIFLGTNYKTDAIPANKITEDDLQDLIVNIVNLNSIDVILKVKTNSEEAAFGYNAYENLPVDVLGLEESTNEVYIDSSNDETEYVDQAQITYKYLKIVANKKTTDDTRYQEGGKYNLELTCYYKKYTVEGYPIARKLTLRNDTLVKNFLINDEFAKDLVVPTTGTREDANKVNVYINTDSSLLGAKININVADPVAVLNQNARFTAKLYKHGMASGDNTLLTDISNDFKIQRAIGSSTITSSVSSGLSEVFDRNTTFYFKPAEGHSLQIGQVFYLEIIAEFPTDDVINKFPAGTDLKATAVVELTIKQGIENINAFDFYSRKYIAGVDVNSEQLKDLRFDATQNQYYVLIDSSLADLEENRKYVLENSGALILENAKFDEDSGKYYDLIDPSSPDEDANRNYFNNTERLEFDETFCSKSEIKIDLTSTFDVNVLLKYLPIGAEISNLTISSSKPSVFSIGSFYTQNGRVNNTQNYFSIIPHSVGEGEVLIGASNLAQVYRLGVRVYKPIASFDVSLSSTLLSSGVGSYVGEEGAENTLSAIVKVGNSIKLNLNTMPLNASEYNLSYFVYDLGVYTYKTAQDLMNIDLALINWEDENIFVGSSQVDFGKEVDPAAAVIGNNDFQFSCLANAFIFPGNESSSKVYCVKIILTNLDGTSFEKQLLFASYVPIDSIDASVTASLLYNPNTLYYGAKTLDVNDPSVFGIKVDVNKNSPFPATFDFRQYGELQVLFSDDSQSFSIKNGFIDGNTGAQILIPVSASSDAQGFYWFRLNENYSYSATTGVIFLNVLVKEFEYTFSKPLTIYVQDATRVSSLLADAEESVYFKQSITPAQKVNISVYNEKSFNKELLIKVFDIVELNGNSYYVETTKFDSVLKAIDLENAINYSRVNKTTISLTFDSNKAGKSVVVVMPQDKVVSKANFDAWNNKQYVSVDLTLDTYVVNFYYTFDGTNYTLASEEYDEDKNYYICSSDVFVFTSLWDAYLKFDVTVADGILVPYQVSTIKDLKEISDSTQTVTKRYVLTNNITLNASENWQPIGNYYEVDLEALDANGNPKYVYSPNAFYTYDASNGTYNLNDLVYNSETTYYLYGFNGELSGVYSFVDIKTGLTIEKYFTIANLSYAGKYNQPSYGLISSLGIDGTVDNLSIRYNYFQPELFTENNLQHNKPILSLDFSFGGVVGVNYGKITNCQVYFNNVAFNSQLNINFGGITGNNFGIIDNSTATQASSFEGIKGEVKLTLKSTSDTDALIANVGGIVGANYSKIIGTFSVSGEPQPTFNDSGFDSSLNIFVLKHSSSIGDFETAIGGAVGLNNGVISNVCVQGNVTCEVFDNVGGLIGKATKKQMYYVVELDEHLYVQGKYYVFVAGVYSICEEINFDETKVYYLPYDYDISTSYSIAKVGGKDNVGGAIGYVVGTDKNNSVKIYNISAENYSSLYSNQKRTLVAGNNNVGGLIGKADYADINYSYAVSYYDNFDLNDTGKLYDNAVNTNNFDVVSNTSNAGGFIGQASNLKISNSAASLYVWGTTSAGIFIASNDGAAIESQNVFATGLVYSKSDDYGVHLIKTLNVGTVSNFGYFSFVTFDSKDANSIENHIAYYDADAVGGYVSKGNNDEVLAFFNGPADIDKSSWEVDSKINAGLPYLVLGSSPLFATTPIEVYATVKDENNYKSYIKYSDSQLVLFYNYDYLNNYQNYVDLILALNMLGLTDLVDIQVFAKTHKSYRLDATTSNSSVISIDANGNLSIVGIGNVIITISSKLNSSYKAEVEIVVTYGLSDINLYSDVSLTQKLEDGEQLDILKNRNQALYLEEEYVRVLGNEANPSSPKASLQSNSEVGVRFKIDANKVNEILTNVENANTVDDLFKFNGISWLVDGAVYYIDVPVGAQPIINPYVAFEQTLTISYIPFIKVTFDTIPTQILLDIYSSTFKFSIKKGATKFVLENNLDNIIAISQLQTQVFTLTLYTDYEDEVVIEEFKEISYISYNDYNLWDVINCNVVGSEEIDNEITDYLSIVKSDVTYKSNGSVLESISITYTVTYKDKINAVEKDRIFRFNFGATSNVNVSQTIGFIILGQDKINQVYGTVYSSLADFPQTPEKNNKIYNGNVGTLSIEVYPFFSNYSKMRVYYTSSVVNPLFITQLSYDITGESGKKLDIYTNSGSITDSNHQLWIEKASGQDTYLFNETGAYSYSKTYFISLLVSTEVPDNTAYTIYVDFLNRNNDIIATYDITITTVAQPGITFGFDESLKGEDDQYYLPLNTTNELDVELNNYEGEVSWEVSCGTFQLSPDLIEALTPYQDNKGNYYLKVMDYLGEAENNIFTSELLGHTLTLKGTIEDGRNAPKFAQNYYEVDIVVTLFTIIDVSVKDCVNEVLTATVSSTTPLYVNVNAYYDKALTENEDNWYNYIMSFVDAGPDSIKGKLITAIKACGYEVEDNFITYITQLQNGISKANYNSSQVDANIKTSGIWYYVSNEVSMNSGYIQSSKTYNSSTFGVEMSNGYFAVYGNQIDINSNLSLRLKLAYNNGRDALIPANGIPNVLNYNLSSTDMNYQPVFNFTKNFILNFVYKSDLINAIPISTAEEFLQMEEGLDYRLINSIELSLYTPISTPIASLDGNNYTIFITSFSYIGDYSEDAVLGLFETVGKSTILRNLNVCYTNKVEKQDDQLRSIENGLLNVNLLSSKYVAFGGIAVTNNGTLTNCSVEGAINIALNEDINQGAIGDGLNGGLVATNAETGYITNSRIERFNLSCHGVTGGIVGNNQGKIVSTYLKSSSINNLSSSTTGGFVNTNNGQIYECYVEGYRQSKDVDIRNTGAGISAKGIIGGFVYSNSNIISDCYSNISLSSSLYIAGFVYTDSQASNISRCYSISYKAKTDNSTIASPFAGTSDETYSVITINGQLNNCFYLTGTESYRDDLEWANKADNKKAIGLTMDEFSTHTNFTNYDLSLVYESEQYADGSTYYYVDGYTWVIIEGKPVIVSTQVKTISQRDYQGKSKTYSSKFYIFEEEDNLDVVLGAAGNSKEKTFYYKDSDNPDTLVYTKVLDKEKRTLTYIFAPKTINQSGEMSQTLTITYAIELDGANITSKELTSCEYGDDLKKVLDVREEALTSKDYFTDSNFRANDTLEILYNADGEIISLQYCVLENANYFYREAADGISYAEGTRTNPQIIYDTTSFNHYLYKGTVSNFYRIIKDIDFNYGYTKTSYGNFQGSLQGNYMNLDKISISYQKDSSSDLEIGTDLDAFGLFAKISTIETQNYTGFKTTNISNLNLNVVEVLSNSHKYVGALAGQIIGKNNGDSQIRVVLNNISVNGYGGKRAFIQGKNAVGGLAGYVTDSVLIKDVSASVSVNATKEMDSGSDADTLLYVSSKPENNGEVAYAGGMVGIFDVQSSYDPSTGKNFNANNLSLSGEVSVIGGIVGSAFGLIGKNAVVNYVNTLVNNSARTFLKSIVYAGGLVGENRGEIISSSVSYGSSETYSGVKPGESSFTNNYFYNGSAKETVVAIGGLVGFNNGGIIRHSFTSVNVRNVNSHIAGGAIGRMLTGKLENVASYGSVTAKSIIGGLIGTLDEFNIIAQNSGYDDAALYNGDVIIKDCVAATNWLVSDYSYYVHLLSATSTSSVAGFIGLVARPSTFVGKGPDGLDFIEFDNCFYTNTLYITLGSFAKPKQYLAATYVSAAYDSVSEVDSSVDVLYRREVGALSEYSQAVWPYSIKETYYEDTALSVDGNLDLKASYTVKETSNNYYIKDQKLITVSDHINFVTGDLVCAAGTTLVKPLRQAFEVSSETLQESVKLLYTYVDLATEPEFETYRAYYGVLYQLIEGSFKKATSFDEEDTRYYFVDTPNLSQAQLKTKYEDSTNDISYDDIVIKSNGSVEEAIIDNVDPTKTNVLLPKEVVINGIAINNIKSEGFVLSEDKQTLSLTFDSGNLEEPLTLPNGSIISNLALQATWDSNSRKYVINHVEINFVYNIEDLTHPNSVITFNKVPNSITQNTYVLNVSSKKVIYKNYLNSGYWIAGKNFLLDNDYINAEKYLINIENAETYTWEEFKRAGDASYKPSSGEVIISTAEELALIAYYVNSGECDYTNVTIKLEKNIDLSGKYWVPIGYDASHSFKGIFDGNDHAIKYATVNSKTLDDGAAESYVTYAGLFGYLGAGATIENLTTVGGAIEGLYAGGIVAYADRNVTLKNLKNSNGVTGYKAVAGIVAVSNGGNIEGCVNYSELNLVSKVDAIADPDSLAYLYAGGIVAYAENETINVKAFEDPVTSRTFVTENRGDIVVSNMKNSYAMRKRIDLTIGGIAGRGNISLAAGTTNKGNIEAITNADRLNIGGIIGRSQLGISNVKNYGDLNITYSNIKFKTETDAGELPPGIVSLNSSAYANIGGVVGYTSQTIQNCGNEGNIDVNIDSATFAFVAIGGICGQGTSLSDVAGKIDVNSSYNSNNINVSTISSRTSVGVGGIIGFTNVTEKTYVIENCYNAGDILTDSNSNIFVGGILGTALVIVEDVFSITAFVDEGQIKGSLIGFEGVVHGVYVRKCLNIGYASITAFNNSINGLGSIAGIYTNLILLDNYYLRGSAYSSNTLFSSVSYWSSVNSGSYMPLPDARSADVAGQIGAREFLSSSLKDLTARNASGEQVYAGWSISDPDDNINTTWKQNYITWYPSLMNNASSALWTDKQEVIYLQKGTYVVSSAEEFAYIAYNINAGLLKTENITIKLSKSIDLGNRFWTPIGTIRNPFKGVFDGQGYTINNLTIDGASVEKDYLAEYNYGGLFGYVENATIKNVGLESPIIQNVAYAGTIAVFANNTRLEKVYTDCEKNETLIGIKIDGEVDGQYVSNSIGAGGLVYNLTNCTPTYDANVLGGIYNCYNNIQLKYEDCTNVLLGGLVGNISNSLISNCYNNSKGKVSDPTGVAGSIKINHIVAQADSEEDCNLFVVFNLADYISNGGIPNGGEKSLFEIINDNGEIVCVNSDIEPLYDNLALNFGEAEDIGSIWTKEYSLNADGYTQYPSLRGLGKEWKNTESEALTNYDYSTSESVFGGNDIASVELLITQDKSLNGSGTPGSDAKHIKMVNPESTYYNQITDRKVYLIETAEELAWIARNVNNGSLVTSNCQFVLLNDIDLANRYWTPIGVSSLYSFQGIFNFNGHTISNLVIDSDGLAYAGLFGYTSNAYITNGHVKNAFVKISSTDDKTNLFAGTVVGRAYNTSIVNVRVSTNVVVHSNSGAFVGGIVGSLTGVNGYQISNVFVEPAKSSGIERGIDYSKYFNCVVEYEEDPGAASLSEINRDTKFGIGAFSTGGNVYAGGVVGYILGYSSTEKYTLENATSNIGVLAVNLSNASDVFVGGVAGYALEEAKINLVRNSGFVKAYSTQYDIVGGVIGYLYNSNITNAYFSGYLEGTHDYHIMSFIGGIVGSMETEGYISNVINNGSICTVDTSIAAEERSALIGGIIGRALDHEFNDDGSGKFESSDSKFKDAVGIVSYSGSIVPSKKEEAEIFWNNINQIIESKFNNEINLDDRIPGYEYWTNGTLKLNHTFLVGGGESFSYNGIALSERGTLVNLKEEIEVTKIGGSNKLKIAYVDKDYNYICKIINIEGVSFPYDLRGVIDANVLDDLIYIYVTLI